MNDPYSSRLGRIYIRYSEIDKEDSYDKDMPTYMQALPPPRKDIL